MDLESVAELERRVRRLEDRAEISSLIARYGMAVDDHDIEEVGRCFTSDAVFEPGGGRDDRIVGREAVLDFYRATFAGSGPSFHYAHTHSLEFDGDDEAHGVLTAHAESAKGPDAYVMALRYRDRYRRENGRWAIAQRRLQFLYSMKLAELATGLAEELRVRRPGSPSGPAELPAWYVPAITDQQAPATRA
jgi:ketosteroid isomerase-like protein